MGVGEHLSFRHIHYYSNTATLSRNSHTIIRTPVIYLPQTQ